MKSPSGQDDARREDLRDGRMRSCTRCYEIKMSRDGYGEQKDVPDARRVFKAILEAIVVVVSWRCRQTRNGFHHLVTCQWPNTVSFAYR